MRDTTPEAACRMRELWAALSGSRRLELAAGMFDSARSLVTASFPTGLSADETRRRLCQRLYGSEMAALYAAAAARAKAEPG